MDTINYHWIASLLVVVSDPFWISRHHLRTQRRGMGRHVVLTALRRGACDVLGLGCA